jgi:MFS family permease
MESSLNNTSSAIRPRIFYGYWILVVSFLGVFIYSGCGVGAFSLFVKPLQAELNWGRGEIMIGFSIFYLLTGIAAPFIGGLIDRYGVRGVVSIGCAVAGLGLASLYRMENLWHFYAAYTAIGVSMAAVGQVPSSAVVSNWFRKHRGTAIGIMSTGIGAGILVLGPFIGAFIMPNFGWRVSYLALALITWMLIPLALVVLRTKPADMGLYLDGLNAFEDSEETERTSFASSGITLRMAFGTSAFWLLAVTFFISGSSSLGVFHSQIPHLQDIGFPIERAATALITFGLGSTIGKFSFGWLCDRIEAKYACAISFFLLALGTIILMCVRSTSQMPILWLYSIVLGLGAGGWLPTMSMLTNTYFGLKSYGAIFGMISLSQAIGGAIGPYFTGYMYDSIHTYRWTFLIFFATFGVAIFAVLLVRHSKRGEGENGSVS